MRDPWTEVTRPRRRRPRWSSRFATVGTITGGALLVGALTAGLTGLSAANRSAEIIPAAVQAEVSALRRELDDARGRLTLSEARLERMNSVTKYSSLYGVPADLSAAIYDIALAEGIHPSLGFQLVKVESGFKRGARSDRGAIGYAQVRLKTARMYQPSLTERDLFDRDTNLRIGFRFMKSLLAQFDQDLNLALLAYNRGPTRVMDMMTRGEDPANGYPEVVMKGVKKGS